MYNIQQTIREINSEGLADMSERQIEATFEISTLDDNDLVNLYYFLCHYKRAQSIDNPAVSTLLSQFFYNFLSVISKEFNKRDIVL